MAKAWSRLSIWQGPAISASGRSLPIRDRPTVTCALASAIIILPETQNGAETRRRRDDDAPVVACGGRAGIADRAVEVGNPDLDGGEEQPAPRVQRLKAVAGTKRGGREYGHGTAFEAGRGGLYRTDRRRQKMLDLGRILATAAAFAMPVAPFGCST